VPFKSPQSLQVRVELPNGGAVTGMGIPRGVTLVVGGGYHGKSTLLRALELGIYNHIPGDGRELVVSNPYTIKIRAEDGRRIEKADISPFIANLPFGQDTRKFSSHDASGSTSQAANIIESLELGAQVLLIDEDTSATNFMIRDHRMQELVAKDKEPITPFIDKVGQLYSEYGVSTILVIGGSGDYFDVTDLVICMKDYEPYQVTEQARAIAEKYRAERRPEGGPHFGTISERIPLAHSFDASKGRREVKISPKGLQSIAFGTHTIDLGAVEQLTDPSQTRAIGDAIYYATRYMDGKRTLREIVEAVLADIKTKGLDALSPRPVGDYAQFRGLELGAAINRLRTLAVQMRNASGHA
jgi:predicted ABC-class ATPase